MASFVLDILSVIIGTVLGMYLYERYVKPRKKDGYAYYVPGIETFERMDIQAPNMTNFSRGTLDRV